MEAFEKRDHDGITPELLDCIVREASLREMGQPDQADSVRKEALQARLAYLACYHGNDAECYTVGVSL